METITLLPWSITVAMPFCYISRVVAIVAWQDEGVPTMSKLCPTTSEPKPEPHGSPVPGPSRDLTPPPRTSPLLVSSLPDIPLSGTPFSHLPTTPSEGKWDQSPSGSPDNPHTKRACITSPQVEVGSEHSHMGQWPHAQLNTRNQNWLQVTKTESPSPLPLVLLGAQLTLLVSWSQVAQRVPETRHPLTRVFLGKHGGLQPGHSLSCSDTNEVSIQTAQKKYRKRVRASCKLSKGSDWMEAQMKRIGDSCQDVQGHDHKIIRTE